MSMMTTHKDKEVIIFSKEFGDNDYSIGEFVGEPNKDGEQDYRGYSVSQTNFSIIADGEDFLAEDEVESLQNGGEYGLRRRSRATLLRMGRLYKATRESLTSLGYPYGSSLNMDEIESLPDEATITRAKGILQDAIDAASKMVEENL